MKTRMTRHCRDKSLQKLESLAKRISTKLYKNDDKHPFNLRDVGKE